MATVFKRSKSKYWQCAFTNVEGRRVYKSTGEVRKGKAQEAAVELEKYARNLDTSSQQEQRAMLAILEEATAHAMRGNLTTGTAGDMLERILNLSGSETGLIQHTVKDWFENWVKNKKKTAKSATSTRYAGIVDKFLDYLPAHKLGAPLHSLIPENFSSYRDHLTEEGLSAATVNLSLKTLRAPLTRAMKLGYIRTNPAEAVDNLIRLPSNKEAFDQSQVSSLLKICRQKAREGQTQKDRDMYRDWELAILLAYYTGQRQSDIANLLWESVDLQAETITFIQEKSGKKVIIPIHPDVFEKLNVIPRKSTNVLCALCGKTSSGRNGLSGIFSRLMKEAQITPKTTVVEGKGHAQNSLSFHSLRHAFNSHLADQGVDQELRKSLTGHSSTKVNDLYTHMGMTTLREAVQKLGSV